MLGRHVESTPVFQVVEFWSRETGSGMIWDFQDMYLVRFLQLAPLSMDFWHGVSFAEVMAPLRKLVIVINRGVLVGPSSSITSN